MFTGIVEEIGTLLRIEGDSVFISADKVLEGTGIGDSISVNGCCLTVVDRGDTWWRADVMEETRKRTALERLQSGDEVNLEAAARLGDRIGGHLVQGHVDAVGVVIEPAPNLRIGMPQNLLKYIIEKGSIAIDGVSLTIVNLYDDGFDVSLIPHTMAITNLGKKQKGDLVNLEVDMIAKYAERLMSDKV